MVTFLERKTLVWVKWTNNTWTLKRCTWSQLILWKVLINHLFICFQTFMWKGLCSAWDRLAQEAICREAFIWQKRQEAQHKLMDKNNAIIINASSAVEWRWCNLNIPCFIWEGLVFETLKFFPSAYCYPVNCGNLFTIYVLQFNYMNRFFTKTNESHIGVQKTLLLDNFHSSCLDFLRNK